MACWGVLGIVLNMLALRSHFLRHLGAKLRHVGAKMAAKSAKINRQAQKWSAVDGASLEPAQGRGWGSLNKS